jgi:UDP-perosamine 4-acetyltransferase
MKDKIVLIGGGGHCKVVIDAIRKVGLYEITGILDLKMPRGERVLGIEVLGGDALLQELYNSGTKLAFITVGSTKDCAIRLKLYNMLKKIGFSLPVIVHPNSVIGEGVSASEGTFVAGGVVINAGTEIGKNAIINTSSSIDHDCEIGDFVHIAPGVILSGGVKVGDSVHIGTGANVVQYLNVGKGAFVPAGVTVIKDVSDNERYLR